jgi:hypothetical protein
MEFKKVTPDNTFISLSNTALGKIQEISGRTIDSLNFKKVLLASLQDWQTVDGTTELHFIVKVQFRTLGQSEPMVLICAMTQGSPAGDKQHTLMIRGALSSEELAKLLSINRGLTALRFYDELGKIGDLANILRAMRFKEPETLIEAKERIDELGMAVHLLTQEIATLEPYGRECKFKKVALARIQKEIADLKAWSKRELDLFTASTNGISNPRNPNELIYRLIQLVRTILKKELNRNPEGEEMQILELAESYIWKR